MNALEKIVEREDTVDRDDDFTVQRKRIRAQFTKAGDQFRKVSRKRLSRLGLENDLVLPAKHQAPKPVPLRFELPAFAFGERLGASRLHRWVRNGQRQR